MHSYETLTANLPLITLIISTHRLMNITPPTMNITNNNPHNTTSLHSLTSTIPCTTNTTPPTTLHIPHPFPFITLLRNPHTPTPLTISTPPFITRANRLIPTTPIHHTTNTTLILRTTPIHNPFTTSLLMNLPSQNFLLCPSLLENQRLTYITMHLNKHHPVNL